MVFVHYVVRIYFIGSTQTGSQGGEKAYGLHEMFANVAVRKEQQPKPVVPVPDREKNAEATILGFIAEHSLPYTIAPALVELVKELSKDRNALNGLSMHDTTALYKMRYGLAKTMHEELVETLRTTKFSMNIDEATSTNLERVLAVLVSYYCEKEKKVVVRHLTSVSVIRVTAEALYDEIVKIMEDNNIPWDNLMSVLMDSCNVMRGSKSGVKVRLRKKPLIS
jgi:hypothetical protein